MWTLQSIHWCSLSSVYASISLKFDTLLGLISLQVGISQLFGQHLDLFLLSRNYWQFAWALQQRPTSGSRWSWYWSSTVRRQVSRVRPTCWTGWLCLLSIRLCSSKCLHIIFLMISSLFLGERRRLFAQYYVWLLWTCALSLLIYRNRL